MTQVDKIINHIETFGSITPLDALREYGCMRLASRMCDIKKAGYKVNKTMETANNRFGEPVRFARYSFEGENHA